MWTEQSEEIAMNEPIHYAPIEALTYFRNARTDELHKLTSKRDAALSTVDSLNQRIAIKRGEIEGLEQALKMVEERQQ